MQNFEYYAPTRVIFGKDTHKQIGEMIKSYGFRKIMLQYGMGSIKKTGLYHEIMTSLAAKGIDVVEMGGVEPNPKLSFVRKAIELAKKEQVEMILAVGGGSAIDSAKYTALGAKYDGDVWDFPSRKAVAKDALPVACILTIAAAGSEMSASAVISNTELSIKRGYTSPYNRCLFAICNPELTYTVSQYQTACGIVDIMTHTMERYFVPCEPTEVTDRVAEGLLQSVIHAGEVLVEHPENYEARAAVMWASSLSHNDLTGCGRGHNLCVHQLEHALSGEYDEIAHGAGLAVLFPAWARFIYRHNIPRFAQFARRVWNVTDPDDETAAQKGIEALSDYFKRIGMPQTLCEFGIPADSSAKLADLCTFGRQRVIPTYIDLDYDKVKDIFESCY